MFGLHTELRSWSAHCTATSSSNTNCNSSDIDVILKQTAVQHHIKRHNAKPIYNALGGKQFGR